jgi:hypothetical protein
VIKVRRKDKFDALQVTEALKSEPGQPSIRQMIGAVTQVELFPFRMVVSTREKRYDISMGDYILKDSKGVLSIIKEVDFKMSYENA